MKIPVVQLHEKGQTLVKGAPTTGEKALSASDVCRACGMCCAGVFFTEVDLGGGEVETLTALAGDKMLNVSIATGEAQAADQMALPCQFLVETSCGIYAQRPKRCQEFKCKLLVKVEQGRMQVSEALSVVDAAKAQVARLLTSVPGWMEYGAFGQNGGVRAKLFEIRRALVKRHKATFTGRTVPDFEADTDFTYQILNYLRFMAEYFHKSVLLDDFEKLFYLKTFWIPAVPPANGAQAKPTFTQAPVQ